MNTTTERIAIALEALVEQQRIANLVQLSTRLVNMPALGSASRNALVQWDDEENPSIRSEIAVALGIERSEA
ncbi:hypothetical protein MUN77_01510 [Leucobacter allii]|uniref:hypothetical protein n=1 Tax=Leucobacter allii TaxID=2932247 RepID=UPI001FD280D5|nr:hypothetical protein [Leucobacter allii]UOR02036.1 hypothetical protein MUN77_01510 [Leucobacter allii]